MDVHVRLSCLSIYWKLWKILRACRLSDPVFLESEVTKSIGVFRKLGYQLLVIDNAHFKARKWFYIPSTGEHEQYQHTVVLPSICKTTTVRKLLNNMVQIYFTTNTSTRDLFCHSITIRNSMYWMRPFLCRRV